MPGVAVIALGASVGSPCLTMPIFLVMATVALHRTGSFQRLMGIISYPGVAFHAVGSLAMDRVHKCIHIDLKSALITASAVTPGAISYIVCTGDRPEHCQQQENAPEQELCQLSGLCLHGLLSGEWVLSCTV